MIRITKIYGGLFLQAAELKKYNKVSKLNPKAKSALLKVKIRRRNSYLLFADMFPVLKQYTYPYINNGYPVYLRRKDIPKAVKYAKRTLSKLNHGMTFGNTFPNISYIKNKEIKLINNTK